MPFSLSPILQDIWLRERNNCFIISLGRIGRAPMPSPLRFSVSRRGCHGKQNWESKSWADNWAALREKLLAPAGQGSHRSLGLSRTGKASPKAGPEN